MARWDDILTLPVQNPPTLEFSSADLVWSSVEGWRETIDRVALIPFSRVDDFVRGESSNSECPSKFHVEARRRRPQGMPCKPRVDGYLEYILYWCSFGPDDHRKGGTSRPSRSFIARKKKSAGRPNTKRGCVCHFIVKRLIAEPSVAFIIYNQPKHVDKKGLPCHGPLDSKAVGTRAMYAPYISDDLRLQLVSLLHAGVPVESIMQKHAEKVEKQGGALNRDDLLTHRHVRRLERSIRRSTFELDPDDFVSIKMWVESHQNHVFFYEDFSNSGPFVLGIQTEWQLQQMINFGNQSLLASDSRFGTHKLKYPVHSLLVFDSNNNAIPVAWIITTRVANNETAYKWIRALYDRVHMKDRMWKLAGFIVDDPTTDVRTIREVFQCSILICFWRVRHAWHKNLVEKCLETRTRAEIFRRLGKAIYSICRENGDVGLFEDFMEDFVDNADFVEYFKATWFPRIGVWTVALKNFPLASQETCAAIESYHHQLKLRLLNEKEPIGHQRADWLVDKLGTEVHSYYWLDGYAGKDDFARYRKDEWQAGFTSWRRASQIVDSDVILESGYAKVISRGNPDQVHVVWNPGSEFSLCECEWSRAGNLCEHVIKVCRVYRNRGLAIPSISLFEYNRALVSMLHCPPYDSLILDQAVSLAVYVQIQLSAIVNSEQNQTPTDNLAPNEQDTVNGVSSSVEISEGGDRLLMNEGSMSGNTSSVREQVLGETADEVGSGCCSSPQNLTIDGQQTVHGFEPGDEISEGRDRDLIVENHSVNENLFSVDNNFAATEPVRGDIAAEASNGLCSSPLGWAIDGCQTVSGAASMNEISEDGVRDLMNGNLSSTENAITVSNQVACIVTGIAGSDQLIDADVRKNVSMEVGEEDQTANNLDIAWSVCGRSEEVSLRAVDVDDMVCDDVAEESGGGEQMVDVAGTSGEGWDGSIIEKPGNDRAMDVAETREEVGVSGDSAPMEPMAIEIVNTSNVDGSYVAEKASNGTRTNVSVIGNLDCGSVAENPRVGFCNDPAKEAGSAAMGKFCRNVAEVGTSCHDNAATTSIEGSDYVAGRGYSSHDNAFSGDVGEETGTVETSAVSRTDSGVSADIAKEADVDVEAGNVEQGINVKGTDAGNGVSCDDGEETGTGETLGISRTDSGALADVAKKADVELETVTCVGGSQVNDHQKDGVMETGEGDPEKACGSKMDSVTTGNRISNDVGEEIGTGQTLCISRTVSGAHADVAEEADVDVETGICAGGPEPNDHQKDGAMETGEGDPGNVEQGMDVEAASNGVCGVAEEEEAGSICR